ncbi:hypothetical protein WJX79_003858 [Trebouxia sp. C0005]
MLAVTPRISAGDREVFTTQDQSAEFNTPLSLKSCRARRGICVLNGSVQTLPAQHYSGAAAAATLNTTTNLCRA